MWCLWMWLIVLGDCKPMPLILKTGHILKSDCGWKQQKQKIVLSYHNQTFSIDPEDVDWNQTARYLASTQRQAIQRHQETDPWLDFLNSVQPKSPKASIRITNEQLQHPVTVKKRQVEKTVPENGHKKREHARKLAKTIRQLRHQKAQLKLQLDSEVTWKQAQHLIEQMDHLDKRIQEKLYWLKRHKKHLVQRPQSLKVTELFTQPGNRTPAEKGENEP